MCRDPQLSATPSQQRSERSVYRASCPAASWKSMNFEVFRQVITAGKLLLADNALVWLYPRVGAAVSGKLVRPGEPAGRNRISDD
ncbi:hypothetical protein CHARACLAT_005160 [Characodon lateralis]|uniref:Uncharacterized protein n=1 Tax=Characodon lateralis TaxID=208331 RepID=A0ABU7DXV4_9TELE|nr:hypothetical protein [Characodon lateralis]